MSRIHIVKQGEYVSAIAQAYGFRKHRTIWNDPANAKLKQDRKNPNVLFPGDRLVIPDRQDRYEDCNTDKCHSFQLRGETLSLRVVVKNESGEAVADADYVLIVESETETKKTSSSGKVETLISRAAQQGQLILNSDTFAVNLNLRVAIGHLDPVDKVTGQIARLNNLGYDAGTVEEPATDVAREQFRSAVEEFQCNENFTVDGKCGPLTQARLKEAHGC